MRTLTFDVKGQSLKPVGDFSGLVARSKGYLEASFIFDSAHKDCKHIAVFEADGEEYPTVLNGTSCVIPSEALCSTFFKVSVVSVRTGYRVQTRKVVVRQHV